MKKISTPQILIIALLLIMVVVQHYKPKQTDWIDHFNKNKKSPYGMLIFNELLKEVFDQNIEYNYDKIYKNEKFKSENSNYIIITNKFLSDSIEIDHLIEYIKNGNNVFIASQIIDPNLVSYLKLRIRRQKVTDELAIKNEEVNNLTKDIFKKEEGYKYTKALNQNYFYLNSHNNYQVLGTNRYDQPNFISIKLGDGKLFLNMQPRVFTNYHLLYSNAEYALNSISYLPKAPTIIDEYYKPYKIKNNSPTQYILSAPPLRIAFYLILIMILINMVFNIKRTQRIIPVLTPPENKSIEYIETIGGLYYASKNHKNISSKLILQFKEYLYEKYFISDISFSPQNTQNISEKTGVELLEIMDLIQAISNIEKQENTNETELQQLNNHIETFYKKCK